jgi:hypothetical protein
MKVLCKKDYQFSEIHTFKKGKYYKVISDYSYQESYWIQNDNHAFQRFGFKGELYPSFYEHFYTEQEMRKFKIIKLNDIAL